MKENIGRHGIAEERYGDQTLVRNYLEMLGSCVTLVGGVDAVSSFGDEWKSNERPEGGEALGCDERFIFHYSP